jgi:hypothetical protein
MAVALVLSDRITALREALPPETAASIVSAADLRRDREAPPLPSGIEGMDRLLAGGYARGKLVEVVGRRSSGRLSLALSALASATGGGENAALIDLGDGFDPQAAIAADVDLRRVLWVRPRRLRDAVYAAETVIAAGFPLVVAELGTPPVGPRVPDATWVRLSRSARAHGTALLVASPYPVSGAAADAVVLLARNGAIWTGKGASPRLLRGAAARAVLEKKRGEKPGRTATARFTAAEAVSDDAGESATGAPSPGSLRSFGASASAAPLRRDESARRPLPPAWPKPLRRGEGPPGEAIARLSK